jgi:hypothetical protein
LLGLGRVGGADRIDAQALGELMDLFVGHRAYLCVRIRYTGLPAHDRRRRLADRMRAPRLTDTSYRAARIGDSVTSGGFDTCGKTCRAAV